jgi:hypothetical protein
LKISVESRVKLHRNRCSSDILGNVVPQLLSGHTQRIQLARHERASVGAGQKERRSTVFPLHPKGSGLTCQQ